MPKRAPTTINGDEPANVQQAAAAEGSAPEPRQPLDLDPTAGPRDLMKLEFFEMLHAMTARQWEDYIVYLYRSRDSGIIRAAKDGNFIAKFAHSFDEADVKEKFGGGKYLAILNNAKLHKGVRSYTFPIEGAPKLQEGEVFVGKPNGATAPAAETEVGLVLKQLTDMTNRLVELAQKGNSGEQDAITRAVSTMQVGMTNALEIQKKAFESTNASATGNPLADELMKTAIAGLGKKDDTMKSVAEVLSLAREINGGGGGAKSVIGALVSEVKEVLPLLKELGFNLGPREPGAPLEGSVDWRTALASQLPVALQMVGGMVERYAQGNEARLRAVVAQQVYAAGGQPQVHAQPQPGGVAQQFGAAPQIQTPQTPQTSAPAGPLPPGFASAGPAVSPAPGAGASPAGVIEFPAAPASATHVPGEAEQGSAGGDLPLIEVNFDTIALLVRKGFDKSHSGDAIASMLKIQYEPQQLAEFQPFLRNLEMLEQVCAAHPLLAPIVEHEDFPVFVAEFVREMSRREEGGNEGA